MLTQALGAFWAVGWSPNILAWGAFAQGPWPPHLRAGRQRGEDDDHRLFSLYNGIQWLKNSHRQTKFILWHACETSEEDSATDGRTR